MQAHTHTHTHTHTQVIRDEPWNMCPAPHPSTASSHSASTSELYCSDASAPFPASNAYAATRLSRNAGTVGGARCTHRHARSSSVEPRTMARKYAARNASGSAGRFSRASVSASCTYARTARPTAASAPPPPLIAPPQPPQPPQPPARRAWAGRLRLRCGNRAHSGGHARARPQVCAVGERELRKRTSN